MARAGDLIALDGSTGAITTQDVPLVDPPENADFDAGAGWADAMRRLGVRANADTPADARRARAFGAAGHRPVPHRAHVHDRRPPAEDARDDPGDGLEERRAALGELLPLQQRDFEGLFEAMAGLPVTIRLLDPPLHEFLPDRVELELEAARGEGDPALLERVIALSETNPMLGTRGSRLGILHPEIYEMQCHAIFRAARAVREREGEAPHVEIMLPLIAYERELELTRALVLRVAAQESFVAGEDFTVGTMIELPRACLLADHIATMADFFSFGTNDLTQTTLGFSRDDIEAALLVALPRRRGVRPLAVRDDRHARRRRAREDGRLARAQDQARAAARGSAASTAATRSRSRSSIATGSTTSAAARSGCRSRASRRARRRRGSERRADAGAVAGCAVAARPAVRDCAGGEDDTREPDRSPGSRALRRPAR